MNGSRYFSFLLATCVLAIVCAHAGLAVASEPITWPFFNWPPYYSIEGDREFGPGFAIQNLLREHLPQFRHVRLNAHPQRTLMLAQHGETICFTGMLKSPDRERFLVYSTIPCRLADPVAIVTLAENAAAFGPAPVSLRQVLRGNRLVLGHAAGFKLGPELDAILDECATPQNVRPFHAESPTNVRLLQLMQKGIDYILEVPDHAIYAAEQIGLADRLAFLPIQESDRYLVGYVACTANATGQEAIRQIDAVLRQEVVKPEYRELFEPWVPPGMLADFRTHFQELIVTPATDSTNSSSRPEAEGQSGLPAAKTPGAGQ